MKRVVLVLVILILIAAAGTAGLLFTATGRQLLSNLAATAHGQDLQHYLVQQTVKIVNTYIEPEIAFDELTYAPPGTIHLDNVRFTADDGTEVVACSRLTVTLAQVPKIGKPLQIETVVLDKPELRLVFAAQPDGSHTLKGLVPFVKTEHIRNQEAQSEDTRLSSILRIRELRIQNAMIEHREEGSDQAMRLDDINLTLTTTPNEDDEPGWHAFNTHIKRAPAFDLDLNGRLNIDTFETSLDVSEVDVVLEESTVTALPVPLQELVREYEARGRCRVVVSGELDLRDPLAADLTLAGSLHDFNLTLQKIRTPISKGEFTLMIKDGVARIPQLHLDTMGGTVDLTRIRTELTATGMPSSLSWAIKDVDLDQFFLAQDDGKDQPKIKGILNSTGSATAALKEIPGSLAGEGEITIRKGQLIRIPFIASLADAMSVLAKVTRASYEPKDKLDITFTLKGDVVDLSKLTLETRAVAARGKGTIKFDKSMDLLVNAGPMEKIQNMLGEVGGILGAVTDTLVKYRVHGTFDAPKVTVKPLGL